MAQNVGAFGISAPDLGLTFQERQWAREDANSAESFSAMMANSAHQREVADLKRAGLNPMLSMQHAGAPSPQGQMARGTNVHRAEIQIGTAAQLRNLNAQTAKTDAETAEVKARTPTHGVGIEKMQQEIAESSMRIEKIIAETTKEIHSAANIAQQTVNLKQQIPQIQATIQQIRAATKLTGEQTAETTQRIKANLPQIDRALKNLEERARELALPRQEMDRSTHDSFIGALSALLRALNPLQSITNIGR